MSKSKNNKRAIDTLDKQLDQLLKNQKDAKHLSNTQPMFLGSSYSPMGNHNIGHQIIPNDNETSPTPKRRKTKKNETQPRNKPLNVPLLPRSKKQNRSANSSRDNSMDSRLISSSPIRKKNVKFAEKLEASEIKTSDVRSSPIQKQPQLPVKSILRRTNYTMNDSPPRKVKKLFVNEKDDDSTIERDQELAEFWSPGDIHETSDPDNFDEYRNFIMKGLEYLENENCDRKYEIYATFAKIMPITAISNVTIKTKEKTGALIGREIMFVIENLDRLMRIILRDMKLVIENDKETVVPDSIYLSRIYHQLVKLITLFFSNKHIVAALIKNEYYIEIVHSIFQNTYKIFGNAKTTKQVLSENLTLLKKEQISEKIFSSKQKVQLISILSNMKEFQSSGIIMEKLSLIKTLLVKYPDEMLEQICGWLPREILLRILMCTSSATQDMLNITIAILHDISEMRTNKFLSNDSLFSCIEVDLPKFTIPKDVLERLLRPNATKSKDKPQTWGLFIRLHAYFLLKEGQFGSVYGLGTSMVKLLYYQKCTSISTLRFLKTQFNEWLDLNKTFFQAAIDRNTTELSIQIWEATVLILWNNTEPLPDTKALTENMTNILQTPFKMVFLSNKLNYALPSIISLLSKLYFLFSSDSYSRGRLPSIRFNRWFNIIKQISLLFFRSDNSSAQQFVITLFRHTINIEHMLPNVHPQGYKPVTNLTILPNISLNEMPCISLSIHKQIFRLMLQLLNECAHGATCSDISKVDYDVPVQSVPLRYFDVAFLMEFSGMALQAYITIPKSLTLNDFNDILSSLTFLFSGALFYDYSADYMIEYLLQIKRSLPIYDSEILLVNLFKTLFKMYTKEGRQYIIIYAFRYINLPVVSRSVCEYIDQVSMEEDDDPVTLYMVIKVLSLCYRDLYFENMLRVIFNEKYILTYNSYNMLTLLHMEEWEFPRIRYFMECYCRIKKSKFSDELFSIINAIIKDDDIRFYIIIGILKSYNQEEQARRLIDINPQMVNASKFLDLDLLPNFVPKNVRKNVILNLDKMDLGEQSKLVKLYLSHDTNLLFKYGTASIGSYVEAKTIFSMEEKGTLYGILLECHKRAMFTFGNRLIRILLSKRVDSVVEHFFRKREKDEVTFFNVDTLVAIVSDVGACAEDGLLVLCKLIQKGIDEKVLVIFENILKQNNTDIFQPCISEIFSTFLKIRASENKRDDRYSFEIFKKIITGISSVNEDVQILFIKTFCSSLIKHPISVANEEYVKYFIDNLELRKLNHANLKSKKVILTVLESWESSKNAVHGTTSSNNSGSTILTPGGLNDSADEKNLHQVQNNIIPGWIKNAKDSNGSSISQSETISSIDDRDLRGAVINFMASDENRSILPEVGMVPNKDSSQEYLAKSTQLEQKKDESVKSASDSVGTIIIEQNPVLVNETTESNEIENENEKENQNENKNEKENEKDKDNDLDIDEESEEIFTLKDGYLQTKYPKLKSNAKSKTKTNSGAENDEPGGEEVKHEMKEEGLDEVGGNIGAVPLTFPQGGETGQGTVKSETIEKTNNGNNIIDEMVNPDSSNIVISPEMGISLKSSNDKNKEINSSMNGDDSQDDKKVSNRSPDLMVKLEEPENILSQIENHEDLSDAIVLESDSDLLDDIDNMGGTKSKQHDGAGVDGTITQEIDLLGHKLLDANAKETPEVAKKDTPENMANQNDKGSVDVRDNAENDINPDHDENPRDKESSENNVTEKNSTTIPSDVVETITQVPQTQSDDFFEVQEDDGPNVDDEKEDDSNKMPLGIKIPIFNFRKRAPSTIQLNRNSPKRRSLRYATSNTVINVNIPKTPRRPASPEPVIRHPTMNESFSNDLVLSDLSGHDSVNSTASLRDRLPTKKARKLVSRIRSISTNDLASLSPTERKTMRLEMLDFLMKLEHQRTND